MDGGGFKDECNLHINSFSLVENGSYISGVVTAVLRSLKVVPLQLLLILPLDWERHDDGRFFLPWIVFLILIPIEITMVPRLARAVTWPVPAPVARGHHGPWNTATCPV